MDGWVGSTPHCLAHSYYRSLLQVLLKSISSDASHTKLTELSMKVSTCSTFTCISVLSDLEEQVLVQYV